MVDWSAFPIAQLGWGGIVTLVVILIIRGDLVPRKVHLEALADRDRWRRIAEETTAQNRQLIDSSRLSVNAMQAIVARAHAADHEQEDGP